MTRPYNPWRLGAPAALALALAFALAACAGTPPTGEIHSARDAIARAQYDGAAELALQPLQMAQDKLGKAESLVKSDDNLGAKRMAEQSAVDAEYADASANAQKAAGTQSELQGAQQQLGRKPGQP